MGGCTSPHLGHYSQPPGRLHHMRLPLVPECLHHMCLPLSACTTMGRFVLRVRCAPTPDRMGPMLSVGMGVSVQATVLEETAIEHVCRKDCLGAVKAESMGRLGLLPGPRVLEGSGVGSPQGPLVSLLKGTNWS